MQFTCSPLTLSFPFAPLLYRRTAIGNDTHDVGIGNELPIDFGLASHALNARSDAQGGHFQRQGIARHNGRRKRASLIPVNITSF